MRKGFELLNFETVLFFTCKTSTYPILKEKLAPKNNFKKKKLHECESIN